MTTQPSTHERATTVSAQPDDFATYVVPTLSRGQRQQILEAIMATGHTHVRILLNPDWDACDSVTGIPKRYTLDHVSSLPQDLHATLLATGRIKEGDFHPRAAWRRALGCTKNAGGH